MTRRDVPCDRTRSRTGWVPSPLISRASHRSSAISEASILLETRWTRILLGEIRNDSARRRNYMFFSEPRPAKTAYYYSKREPDESHETHEENERIERFSAGLSLVRHNQNYYYGVLNDRFRLRVVRRSTGRGSFVTDLRRT